MCGIAGYIAEHPAATGLVAGMVAAQDHRGPDSQAFHRDGAYEAGMCRLAINDLENGEQPLTDESGRVVLLYNGEIYNAPALRRDLETRGYRFRTRSDGEVICHLYHEYGLDLFERLDGMFAAALWIADERKLVLARDLAGEKPLHYAQLPGGGLAFSSEIRGLEQCLAGQLTLDRQAIWDFPTFLWIPEPATIYREVRALPRGHLMVVEPRREPQIRPYANRFGDPALTFDDDDAVVEETRRVVEEAVKSRLLSDVPIGAFLSGGLDSSIVTALAARRLDRLTTFSIGFENVSDPYHGMADESADAALHAARIGSEHHAIHVTANDFRDLVEPFAEHGDQPFAVSSGLGILAIARAAQEAGIKVLLSGDGADECFGGYSWYAHLASPHLATGAQAKCGTPVSFQNFGAPLESRLAAMGSMPPPERAWAWHYYAHESEKAALFDEDWREGLTSSLRHFCAFDAAEDWPPETYVAQDRDLYFPQEMLRKVDRMTMAYSVEGRVPFAAPAVLSHAAKLRFSDMVRGDTLKWALRRAFADVLSPEVAARPKHGFNVPIDHWLKGPWHDMVEETFATDSALACHGMLAPGARTQAENMLHDPKRLNGHTLLCYIMLDKWLRRRRNGNHR